MYYLFYFLLQKIIYFLNYNNYIKKEIDVIKEYYNLNIIITPTKKKNETK